MTLRPNRLGKAMAPMPAPVIQDGCLTICLPIPDRGVSPNAGRGQSRYAAIKKSRLVKRHRIRAKLATVDALARFDLSGVTFTGYSLDFYFPTLQFRDDDNADGSCKAYRDGIAEALRIDDRSLRKRLLSTISKDALLPRVEITLHP